MPRSLTVELPELLVAPPALFAELSARTTTASPTVELRGRSVSVLFSVGLLVLALLSVHRAGRAPASGDTGPDHRHRASALPSRRTPSQGSAHASSPCARSW